MYEGVVPLYEQARPCILGRRSEHDPHPESVHTTFLLSWQAVKERNPLAGRMLQCAAFLAPDRIPEEIIAVGIILSEQETKIDMFHLDKVFGLLYRYVTR